jgi:NADH-quinone oxidoreductase subunit M
MNAGIPILSIILWLPALGALLLMFVPGEQVSRHRQIALIVSVVAFVLSCFLPLGFIPSAEGAAPGWTGIFGFMQQGATATLPGMRFVDQLAWIPSLGIHYLVGVDGISLWMVVLTTFLTPVAILSTWHSVKTQVRAFQALMLLLETAMLGVFVAQDMFLFYVFWEFSLVPMAFMIGIWGSGNRIYAAVKFFLYTFAGSVLMLMAIIALAIIHRNALAAGDPEFGITFNVMRIMEDLRSGNLVLDTNVARLMFGAFFLAFAIKVPMWPFHTWLPDAHVEAPTAGSVILAGVLLKMGTYGLIRFNLMLFPEVSRWAAPAIAILAIIGIIYGAIVAFAQSDMKKLVAYSSVSHMGFIVLGIFALNPEGISGAILQMVNHGLSTGALFVAVGIIYERRHTRELAAFGGLWTAMPIYGGLTLVMVLSSVGLPGLNGFIGEFTIMQGAYLSPDLGWHFLAFAVIGVILAAVYLMRMFGRAFMGPVDNPENAHLPDLDRVELASLVVPLVPIVIIGFLPNLFFAGMQGSVAEVVQHMVVGVAGQ